MSIQLKQSRKTLAGNRQSRSGFTLIELMITVAIVAILASIAYPAYTAAMLKGRRAEGRAGLTMLMQQQERYFTQNGSYLGFNGPTDTASNTAGLKSQSGDGQSYAAYAMGAARCPGGTTTLATCVLVFAIPVKADPDCGTLTIVSNGLSRGFSRSMTVSGTGASTAVSAAPDSNNPTCWP